MTLLILLATSSFCVPVAAFALFLVTPAEEHRFSSENIATSLQSSFGVAIVSIFVGVTCISFMEMFGRLNARKLLAILELSFLPMMAATVAIAATLFYRIALPHGLRFTLFFFTTSSLLLYLHPYHASQRVYFLPSQPLAIEEDLST